MYASRRFKITFGILSVCYLLLGAYLIAAQQQAQRLIGFLLGAFALIMGIVLVCFYFIKDNTGQAFRSGLASGVVLVAAGFYLFAQPDFLWRFLPVLLGFAVLYDSVIKLQSALDIKKTGFGYWWVFLVLSIVTAVLGLVLVVFGAGVLLSIFGSILIADGAINLAIMLFSLWRARKAAKEEEAQAAPAQGRTKAGPEAAPPHSLAASTPQEHESQM